VGSRIKSVRELAYRPSGQQLRTPDGRKCWAGNAVRQVGDGWLARGRYSQPYSPVAAAMRPLATSLLAALILFYSPLGDFLWWRWHMCIRGLAIMRRMKKSTIDIDIDIDKCGTERRDKTRMRCTVTTRYRPGGCETICPRRRWQFDGGKNRGGSTSAVRTSLVAGGG